MNPKVSIVVPAYQEVDNLPTLIAAIKSSLKGEEYEVIIVDDNSSDGTGELADELTQIYDNVKVIHRNGKRGTAFAIADGVRIATGEVIGTINADMQHPPELLPVMLQQIGEHDIVIASRHVSGGHRRESFWRRFVSKGAAIVARLLLPKVRTIKDPMSGFFLFKKEVIEGVPMLTWAPSRNISIGVKFSLELLVKGRYNSVIEVPYTFERRKTGKSKFRLIDYFTYLRHVFQLLRTSGEFKRMLKFCIVGGSSIGVYEGTLFLLTDKLGLLYLISAIFSWVITILFMFTLHESWTFRDLRKRGISNFFKRALRFGVVRATGFAINLAILFCLTQFLGVYYLVSALIAIAIVMIWNYTASLNLVWKR